MKAAIDEIIFVLQHNYITNEGDKDLEYDHPKNLFYSAAYSDCEKQIDFYRTLPGFCDYPNGFRVLEIRLNRRRWDEGFVVYQYPI